MLELKNVSKSFAGPQGPVATLRGLDLSLRPGDFVAVRGPSGCGKSTLLLVAGGLLKPDAGTVSIKGTDIYGLDQRRRSLLRATSVGFVFQQFHLVPYLSILDNIMAPALAVAGGQARERANEMIKRFQLADRAMHVPAKLSVGEQQRAALARAMINTPALILADEPTGNLDPDNAAIVMSALAGFTAAGGCVLLVTHDERAEKHAKTAYRMQAGMLAKPV